MQIVPEAKTNVVDGVLRIHRPKFDVSERPVYVYVDA